MTLETQVQEKIDAVVAGFLREGRMFTAFEVTLAAKELGVEERHRQLRDNIHATVFRLATPDGNYTRTLLDVGAPEQAWLYHPIATNPYEYVPLDRTNYKPVPASARPRGLRNPSRLALGAGSDYAVPQGAFGTDGRGRLCIPVSLLARLGVHAGDRVNVLCDPANEQALLTKSTGPTTGDSETSYTAETDGNVRMTQGTLEKAGLDCLQVYHIDGNDTVISVRKFA
jgi:hypothetical protein